jgi:hypothetical protein
LGEGLRASGSGLRATGSGQRASGFGQRASGSERGTPNTITTCLVCYQLWQKPVTFSDFAGEFFLIWFFPVGIWIIQPRINKLFDTNIDNNNQTLDL